MIIIGNNWKQLISDILTILGKERLVGMYWTWCCWMWLWIWVSIAMSCTEFNEIFIDVFICIRLCIPEGMWVPCAYCKNVLWYLTFLHNSHSKLATTKWDLYRLQNMIDINIIFCRSVHKHIYYISVKYGWLLMQPEEAKAWLQQWDFQTILPKM